MAHTTLLHPAVPLAYTSQAHLEPRSAFEYSSSVQTADYANHASVKSDNAGLVAAPVTQVLTEAVPALRTVELNSASVVHSAPVVQSVPVAYTSQAIVAPRAAFEYSSSVKTADYSNHASVKSDNAGLVATPVTQVLTEAVPVLRTVEVKSAPVAYSTPVVHSAPLVHSVPLAYTSQSIVEPRRAFEYSSSVQTADYANYASVKSDNAGLVASAPVTQVLTESVPAVRTVQVQSAPLVHATQVVAANPAPLVAYRSAVPSFYAHSPAIVAPQTYAVQYTQHLAQPQQQVLLKTAPQVQLIEHHAQPLVEVKEAATVVVAAEPAPIVEHQHILLNEKSQYHSQDSLGQAAYGHSEALQTHNAIQDAAGNKAGSYSYVAPDGRVLTTDYVADENGYRVATNALPVHQHSRRRRSLIATVASVPVVKEATFTHIPGHSSTARLDTTHANLLTAAVPAVYTAPAYPAHAYSLVRTAPLAHPIYYY